MRKSVKIITWLLIAIFIHFLIKIYDASFKGQVFQMDKRGVFFLVFMVVFMMTILALADAILKCSTRRFLNKFSFNKRFTVLSVIFLVYGIFVVLGFSFCYTLFDYWFFGFWHYGKEYQFLDFDANLGMYMAYLAILLFNGQFYLLRHSRESELKTEKLEKERLQSQYQALKNQVDPHFFFNSLSVLTSLVYKDADLSADYITQLSKMYRYTLDNESKSLAPLKTELNILDSYIFLIKIRHGDAVNFKVNFSETAKRETYIPPNALQMLAENAIKHNRFSVEEPLSVDFYEENDYLVVKNEKRTRKQLSPSPGIGLENISKRYGLLCNCQVVVSEERGQFIVKLPKLKNSHENPHF